MNKPLQLYGNNSFPLVINLKTETKTNKLLGQPHRSVSGLCPSRTGNKKYDGHIKNGTSGMIY